MPVGFISGDRHRVSGSLVASNPAGECSVVKSSPSDGGLMGVRGGRPVSPGKLKLARLTNRSSPPQFRLEASSCLKKSMGEPVAEPPPKSLCKLSNREAAAAAAAAAAVGFDGVPGGDPLGLRSVGVSLPLVSASNLAKSSTNLNLSRPLAAAIMT